jgi:hypothetical protein
MYSTDSNYLRSMFFTRTLLMGQGSKFGGYSNNFKTIAETDFVIFYNIFA